MDCPRLESRVLLQGVEQMIVYRCDISGRDLMLEDVQAANRLKLEYAKSKGWFVDQQGFVNAMAYNQVCDSDFTFHPDYHSMMFEYWDSKLSVIEELSQTWASRIQNHRKAFFRPQRKGNGSPSLKAMEHEN